MNKMMNLQDIFLNQARKEKIVVTVFLTNGYQFKGIVKGFDSYVVIMDCDGKQNLVYKHAISTVVPTRAISILDTEKED
ncbi:MAG: RNA chaperone Hfq [Ruminococcus sp.]|nr:RNA chaperone Hfq [Ruminococcus sp.]CDE34579.1 protein hfq [Ruminococcus sp. CAG:403]